METINELIIKIFGKIKSDDFRDKLPAIHIINNNKQMRKNLYNKHFLFIDSETGYRIYCTKPIKKTNSTRNFQRHLKFCKNFDYNLVKEAINYNNILSLLNYTTYTGDQILLTNKNESINKQKKISNTSISGISN